TSATKPSALRPAARSFATASVVAARLRSTTAMAAPSAAKRSAAAKPMAPAPPVTSATLSVKRSFIAEASIIAPGMPGREAEGSPGGGRVDDGSVAGERPAELDLRAGVADEVGGRRLAVGVGRRQE